MLSLPPHLMPSVTDSAWFAGPVQMDEDAALSALELAYETQVFPRHRTFFSRRGTQHSTPE